MMLGYESARAGRDFPGLSRRHGAPNRRLEYDDETVTVVSVGERSMKQSLLNLIVLPLVMLACQGLSNAQELDEAEFNRLCDLLQPSEDEPWRTIPWKIDVLDAQQAAADEGKPIFIWAMDGHPLGCT